MEQIEMKITKAEFKKWGSLTTLSNLTLLVTQSPYSAALLEYHILINKFSKDLTVSGPVS